MSERLDNQASGRRLSSCAVVIGETDLAVECARLLLRRGHGVIAVCSPDDAPLRGWADTIGVTHFSDISELTDFARGVTLDYLFSIVNYRVLPLELLRIPRLPINFHDGPLPRYAGVYATSWAIINGEEEHGITWHVMVDKVDAGDILKRRSVPVAANDTACDLNMKCFVAAYRAFAVLLSELETDSVVRIPQDLSKRTYYSRSRLSPEISWEWGADQIVRFCRALSFYPSPSPVGSPFGKLYGWGFYITKAERCESASGQPIGTVVAEGDDYLRIAVSDGDVNVYTPPVVTAFPARTRSGQLGDLRS